MGDNKSPVIYRGRRNGRPEWYQTLMAFKRPDHTKAVWQMVNTFGLYVLAWALMILNLGGYQSGWIHIYLLVIAAGLQVRIFIIFHDCCHQTFLASRRMNTLLGHICGVLTFTPYESWRRSHGIHHNTVNDLDRRGRGDVWTLTVDEYRAASRFKRLRYRLFRNPLVLLIIGPVYLFLFDYRFPEKGDQRKQIRSLHMTNLGIAALVAAACWLVGWRAYLLIQLPIILISGAGGVWLFYVQHQFEGAYWARHEVWDPMKAALKGFSFYQLPKLLQWFSGNIGFHHIHHISPRIPNYHLERCHEILVAWQVIKPLNLRASLHSLRLKLWDEQNDRLVGFGAVKNQAQTYPSS